MGLSAIRHDCNHANPMDKELPQQAERPVE